MSATRKNIFWFIFITIIIYKIVEAYPPPEPQQQQQQQQQKARSFRNALNQQEIQSHLQSIENRLSNLDQIYSHRYAQRVDSSTDQYVRKIEMLESKLSRLEFSLNAQLEKLSENLSSKNFRDDITKDQIFRKIDSVYERFNHKLTYVEEKFDIAFIKLQNKIDVGVLKIERLDDSINVRHADMESEISEGVQIMKTVKNNMNSMEEKIMNVTRISFQNLEEIETIHSQYINITRSLDNIENKLVNISSQSGETYLNDFSKNEPSSNNNNNYSYKINNMYNELWNKSHVIENNIQNSVHLMNLTRKEIQDIFIDIKQKTANSNNDQNDGTLDIILDSFTNFLQKKFTDLGKKMDYNFGNIITIQNLFLESCNRIQKDETQLEAKISLVLEKLLDSLSNRSLVSFKELQSTEEIIKLQSSNMERLITQNTNIVMKLSEKTSEDRKKIEKILSTIKKDFANFMTTIEHEINLETLERSDKLDNIGNLILELLDRKMNKDNMNYNAKQMLLEDVLQQTKDIFAKQLNISVLHNTIIKVDDIVQDIRELLYNINTKINKYVDVQPHLHKINDSQIINFDANKNDDENVDIVFGENDKTINLFRYNYSVIDDKSTIYAKNIPPILNINLNEISEDAKNNTEKTKINIPYDITVPPPKNIIDDDDEMFLSSEEQNDDSNSSEHNKTNLNKNKPINSTKNENITLEKPITLKISGEKNENNIISIDNDDKETSNSEESTNEEIFTNIPPSDSDATSKIESNESEVDILEELYEKFFGNIKNMQQQNDASLEYNTNKPEIIGDYLHAFATTTDLVDNTDYDDNFYE